MSTQIAERIILIGLPGSGKTTTGQLVASLLGWPYADVDDLIERAAGKRVERIFAEDGEQRFRELECRALAQALEPRRVVIATGGGCIERADNRALLHERGWVAYLATDPETAHTRLAQSADEGPVRPLLAGDDALARMRVLLEQRERWYCEADGTFQTDGATAEMIAARIVAWLVAHGSLPDDGAAEQVRHVGTAAGEGYDAVVGWGALARLGERLRALGLPARVFLVADANVAILYEAPAVAQLTAAGFEPVVYRVPAGEASKSREGLNAIHDWLAERRAERGEAVIALGGGVVGDLAGFAAATYLRGMRLVQVPTSLLAQVDASIGGKVAIDHPQGKNLIGAFYPPRLVLADAAALLTMPARQRIEGWAEVVKHGVALDAAYFESLEREVDGLLALEPRATTEAIAQSVALKAGIVQGDEREREGGQRHLLNYGHTVGHAVEAVAGYGAWLHGEAVAAGMMTEALLGRRLGITAQSVVERQGALLARFGLPTRLDGLTAGALMRAALWDKKVASGRPRWVLPDVLGSTRLVRAVPDEDVRAALLEAGAVDDEPPPAG
jgi:shikimate kinase / 3-dehydroquinate synthase